MNVVQVPDGSAYGIGGNSSGLFDVAQKTAVAYDPAADTWTTMAAQSQRRAYHSTAILLPDGRIMSAGDNGADVTPPLPAAKTGTSAFGKAMPHTAAATAMTPASTRKNDGPPVVSTILGTAPMNRMANTPNARPTIANSLCAAPLRPTRRLGAAVSRARR